MISDCKAFWTWVWTSFGPREDNKAEIAGGLGREQRQALLSGNINSQGTWCPYGMWHSQQRVSMWTSESRLYFGLIDLFLFPVRHTEKRTEKHWSTRACREKFFIALEGDQVSLFSWQSSTDHRHPRKEMCLSMPLENFFQTLFSASWKRRGHSGQFWFTTWYGPKPRLLTSEVTVTEV